MSERALPRIALPRIALPRIAIVSAGVGHLALDAIGQALRSLPPGQAWVQLRDHQASDELIGRAARQLRPLLDDQRTPLIINRTIELAIACDADGVHLAEAMSQGSELERRRRDLASSRQPNLLLGTSRHNAKSAKFAQKIADYVMLGPIWPTIGKPNAIGLEALAEAAAGPQNKHQTTTRQGLLFAIGGIKSPSRAKRAIVAGADGIAGIRAFNQSTIAEIAKAVLPAVDSRSPTS